MRAVREVRWVQYSQLSRLRSHDCTVDGLFRFPIFLKTLNWRDGTGDNSFGNWSLQMIHQKMIDSEDFTTQSISPVTSSAHKPDRDRRFKNFCTVIFPISARQRPQCQKPQSIDWAHLNFTCAGACRTLTEPLPNPYQPLPTLTGNRFMPNTHCIDQYAVFLFLEGRHRYQLLHYIHTGSSPPNGGGD